ncbi:MAG TPA: DinB family protein [Pyrinomonadaceae bacterium]|jgi:hypothetical protein
MDSEKNVVISELEKISADTQARFGSLSPEQINWRPSAEGWSVGQCFEHLIKTNKLFDDELEKIAAGNRKNSFWESWSPLTSFGGKFLIKSLKSDERKFKAPTQKIVPPSEIDGDIIEQFAGHQREVIEKIRRTENADWRKTVITSPFMKLMTYSFDDGLQVIVEHEKRHFRQAERVLQADGFPK